MSSKQSNELSLRGVSRWPYARVRWGTASSRFAGTGGDNSVVSVWNEGDNE